MYKEKRTEPFTLSVHLCTSDPVLEPTQKQPVYLHNIPRVDGLNKKHSGKN